MVSAILMSTAPSYYTRNPVDPRSIAWLRGDARAKFWHPSSAPCIRYAHRPNPNPTLPSKVLIRRGLARNSDIGPPHYYSIAIRSVDTLVQWHRLVAAG